MSAHPSQRDGFIGSLPDSPVIPDSDSSKRDKMTMTVLGCGTLGIAILAGIFSSQTSSTHRHSRHSVDASSEEIPPRTPSRFITCVTRPHSAKRIKTELEKYHPDLKILQNKNLKGAREADIVLLACKPYHLQTVLQEEGMRDALAGKLLISILAGVPVEQIEATLYGPDHPRDSLPSQTFDSSRCRIIRAMPNTASQISQSMTVIATPTPPLPSHFSTLTTWIFSRIGRVVHLPPTLMDASTALCGSGPAFCALVLEALADGGVAMGIPRAEAQVMAAQTMKGAAGLVLEGGEHPALLRDKVSTPGGCTIGGLLVLEEGGVRGTVARGVREAAVVAAQLGKGMQGVNGTRH